MLGNDQYGDCVAVTWANVRRLMTRGASYPDLAAVETFYKTQNPNFPADDNGMDIQTALEALVHDGGPDGVKAVAFAKVDQTNLDEVKAALAIFGYVWTGCNVQHQNMADFDAGQPWQYRPNDTIDGGHSIISGGYTGQVGSDVKFVTWAQETSFTDSFWANLVEEAWVAIWPEHFTEPAFLSGIDQAALAADYKAITGSVLVVPTPPAPPPTPAPTPVPPQPPTPPGPDTADIVLWASVRAWTSARHFGANRKTAAALVAWAKSKGLQ